MYENLLANVPTDLWIGGKWRKASDGGRFDVLDPATENKIASVASATVDDAKAAVDAASAAFAGWAARKPRDRAEILRKSYELIMRDAERLAKLITIENGKALSDSRGEVAYAAEFFRWYAEEAVRNIGELTRAPASGARILVHHKPAGVAVLVTGLEGRSERVDEELDRLPGALAEALLAQPDAEAVARHLASAHRDRLIVVGRGYEYATARELALKLKELARVAADPYSAADFLHGPLALAEPGHPILVLAPSGAAAADVDGLLQRLGDLGVEPIVVSDRAEAVARGAVGIRLPSGVADWLMPIVSIVPGQLLARHLAIARGLDPEAPRWIAKVTLTR
jgi:hypothetical protein